jgi:hypothetical protein
VEHTVAAQVFALLGGAGAVLVLLARDRVLPLVGFALLGVGTAGLGRSLVGDDDLELLFTEPRGISLVVVCALLAVLGAIPLVRYPEVTPVALLAVAPFRIPVELGNEDAFLLVPLYLVLAATTLAVGYRLVRGYTPPAPPRFLVAALAAFVAFASLSYLWTWDERAGAISLAFFVFPFTAGFGVVARAPLAAWLPRALLATVVGLGVVFASIGIWQSHSRTLFFGRDVEVANAYTSFFRVTSLFKDPSLYGRYLVIPIAVLLVAVLLRRNGNLDWIAATAIGAFLFWGLYYSYSQSSFVALFVVTFAVALLVLGKRLRVVLLVAALAVTLAAFEARPVVGVGIGGQPRASTDLVKRGSPNRNASHTTALTVLAELGIVGLALYAWLLGAAAWAFYLVATRRDRMLGIGLAAVLLVLVVHSMLYAGFFEDPLTWGVLALAAAALASPPRTSSVPRIDQAH